MESLWKSTAKLPHFAELQQDITTDVLVVGGGIAGLLCAWRLKQAGVETVLVEADELGGGITGNTTAKITSQHGLLYDKLTRTMGRETARLYLQANEQALQTYRELCQTIDCDFEEQDAFVYSLHGRQAIEKEVRAVKALGFPAELVTETALPFPVAGAVRFGRQAQFHPLKFLSALVKELTIFEHTRVLEWQPGLVVTDRGKIQAQNVIITTHFPMLDRFGCYFLKLYQRRSYVLALRGAPALDGMYIDASGQGLSFRRYKDLLLLGGGGHRTGKPGEGWRPLEEFAHRTWPRATEVSRWAAQDCMTLDGMPYIGQYSPGTPHLYVATGFNKWGMTSAMAAAAILTDLVQGKENPYANVFSPSRSILHPQLAVNAWESTIDLLTPTVPRCPHLGCALKYNAQEHSWDCPCHGSRFTARGRLLDNPAEKDIRV